MNRVRTAIVAALLVSFAGLDASPVLAQRRDRDRDRYEERWERRQERREREARREARQEWRERQRDAYWDAARYYRSDSRRYAPYRMSRSDRIYRGSDNRYYCRRDDGTTGLIIGGVAGAVLGNIIVPGESKVIGTIIGGGAGALIGRAIDDGDIVCR